MIPHRLAVRTDFGLLWQKDPGSHFPFSEIRRACHRFPLRPEFRGWRPTRVYIHPDHADLLKNPPEKYEVPEGVTSIPDDTVALFYIVVTGEPRSEELDVLHDQPDPDSQGRCCHRYP